jgi:hypothetical protein
LNCCDCAPKERLRAVLSTGSAREASRVVITARRDLSMTVVRSR